MSRPALLLLLVLFSCKERVQSEALAESGLSVDKVQILKGFQITYVESEVPRSNPDSGSINRGDMPEFQILLNGAIDFEKASRDFGRTVSDQDFNEQSLWGFASSKENRAYIKSSVGSCRILTDFFGRSCHILSSCMIKAGEAGSGSIVELTKIEPVSPGCFRSCTGENHNCLQTRLKTLFDVDIEAEKDVLIVINTYNKDQAPAFQKFGRAFEEAIEKYKKFHEPSYLPKDFGPSSVIQFLSASEEPRMGSSFVAITNLLTL